MKITDENELTIPKKKDPQRSRRGIGSTTGQETADDADGRAEDQNAGRKKQIRIRSNGINNSANPSKLLSNDLTKLGEKRTHSRNFSLVVPP